MWRHHNICWKWPPFASRQHWNRRAIFWKLLASTSAVTAWISLVIFVFKASRFRGFFSVNFLSGIPIINNQAHSAKWRRDQQRGASDRKQAGQLADRYYVSQQLGALQTHPTDTFLFICHIKNVLLFKFRCNIFIGVRIINPLKPELNPICYLLALLAHHFLHVARIRVKSLTITLLMSYIYGAPILDVSRSHTTTQHSR